MNGYTELSGFFDEDRLPPGQVPILTAGVKQCQMAIELLIQSRQKTGYSTMAVITGWSGVGKTVAIQACIEGLTAGSLTGLPTCIHIKVKPGSTPKQLVEDVFICFGEKPRSLSTNRYKIADAAAEAILCNGLQVLFVDDADQLTTECFELLRYIFAKTGCPIVVVGLRHIIRIIDQHEKFQSRVGPRLDFPAPQEEEVLSTFLPQLVMPHWSFDPTLEVDYAVGKMLWASVRPSLRSLRVVIQYASTLADMAGEKRISLALLKQSYQMALIQKKRGSGTLDAEEEEVEEQPQTEFERESEDRHRQDKMQDEETE